MKALIITATLALVAMSSSVFAGEAWMTDIDAALAKGKQENKPVLAEFTGSDWCPPCMMMHKKVFSKSAFTQVASKSYILVKIDIPQGNKALYEKNAKVLSKYKVEGVPTVILFNSEGKEFDRFIASSFPSIQSFLSKIDQSLKKSKMN